MSTTELIEKIKTLPRRERKAVVKALVDDLEEEADTRLYDERMQEPDGPTLEEVIAAEKNKP